MIYLMKDKNMTSTSKPFIAPFLGHHPEIDASAYIAETVAIVGAVRISSNSSIWHQVTLRGGSPLPHIAGCVAIGIFTALDGEQFRRTALSTAFGSVFVDALSINARIGRTGRIIVAVRCDVTAAVDGRIVADVICSALVFSTRIPVVTIGLRQTAIELFRPPRASGHSVSSI